MSITLDTITLPDLAIDQDYGWTGVASTVERTLQGRAIVTEQLLSGNALDLYGGSDWGWIQRSDLVALVALAKIPYATYTLDYEGSIYVVRFRNEDSPPVEATPLMPRPNPDDEDYYNNLRIKLMEV